MTVASGWRNYRKKYQRLPKGTSSYVDCKKENVVETYESLKNDYLLLKAVLTSLGVNLTDIDKIKEKQIKISLVVTV